MVDRPATSEIRQSLKSYPVFGSAPFEAATGATTLQSDTAEALTEELGPNGIGYVLVSELINQPSLKALQLHKTPPTDPRYPFSQPYSLVYARGVTLPAVAALLGYATGQAGQAAVARVSLSDNSSQAVVASPTTGSEETAGNAEASSSTSPNAVVETNDAGKTNVNGTLVAPIVGIGTLNADGQLVDTEGKLINSEGFLIDTEGELIDADGNLLAEGANGVLGAGIDPDAIRSGIDDVEGEYIVGEIDEESGNISSLDAERGRWWWLLLPLAGLALLIWAAGKNSSEEETGYATSSSSDSTNEASTSIASTNLDSVQDDRIVSNLDSSTVGNIDGGSGKEAEIGLAVAGGAGAADVGLAAIPDDPTTTTVATTTDEPTGPISTKAANGNDDIDGFKSTAQPDINES